MLLLCLVSADIRADAEGSEYTIRRSPTMAAFYTVSKEGRSVPEVVDVVMIADPDAKPGRAVVTGRSKSRQKARRNKLRRASTPSARAPHDSFAEYRCERYGFYYTSSGNCVVPAATYRYSRYAGRKHWHGGKSDNRLKASGLHNLLAPDPR